MNKSLPDLLKQEAKEELTKTANLVLEDRLDIIEGSRFMLKFASRAGIANDEIFLPVIGFESQTDHLPVGELRKHYGQKYLKELDQEKGNYINEFKSQITEICREIIKKFS